MPPKRQGRDRRRDRDDHDSDDDEDATQAIVMFINNDDDSSSSSSSDEEDNTNHNKRKNKNKQKRKAKKRNRRDTETEAVDAVGDVTGGHGVRRSKRIRTQEEAKAAKQQNTQTLPPPPPLPRRKPPVLIHNPAYEDYDEAERKFFKQAHPKHKNRIAQAEIDMLDRLAGKIPYNNSNSSNRASTSSSSLISASALVEHHDEEDDDAFFKGPMSDDMPVRFRILTSGLEPRTKIKALRKLELANYCGPMGSEYGKTMGWLDAVCALPIGVYKSLPVQANSPISEIGGFLDDIQKHISQRVHGHDETKGHIVRLLARWITNPNSKGLVLGIHGEMGTGKTRLCQSVCQVLGLPFSFLPLGGTNDGCFLTGHSYTYEGAIWGRIADALMKAKCMNPVLFFDEVDKVSDSTRGQEIINTLIHLTDPTQNSAFNDKYFAEIDLDLSRCLVIFSYNDENKVSPILRDRMTRVNTNGYGMKDKLLIAREHLLPEIMDEYSLAKSSVVLPDEAISHLVSVVEEEKGVRNLRRGIIDVISNINLERLLGKRECTPESPVYINREMVQKYVSNGCKRNAMSLSVQGMYC